MTGSFPTQHLLVILGQLLRCFQPGSDLEDKAKSVRVRGICLPNASKLGFAGCVRDPGPLAAGGDQISRSYRHWLTIFNTDHFTSSCHNQLFVFLPLRFRKFCFFPRPSLAIFLVFLHWQFFAASV